MLSINTSQTTTNAQMSQKMASFRGKTNSKPAKILLSKTKMDTIINNPKLTHVEKRDQLTYFAETKLDKMGLFAKLRYLFKHS